MVLFSAEKIPGSSQPSDLSGRKIGFLRWVQTAAIWMRGMLVDSIWRVGEGFRSGTSPRCIIGTTTIPAPPWSRAMAR